MRFVTVSKLRADATKFVSEIESGGEEVVVTKNGKPVALLMAIDESAFSLTPEKREEIGYATRKGDLSKRGGVVAPVRRSGR